MAEDPFADIFNEAPAEDPFADIFAEDEDKRNVVGDVALGALV